jgi:branched-chain amino acid transport system substrate-binding protein
MPKQPRHRRWLSLSVALVAICAVVAGCGDNSSSGSASGDKPVATDGDTLLIGALVDLSGPSQGNRKVLANVLPAWEKYINDKGGIGGHPVKIDLRDTQGNASKAQSEATSLLAEKPVAWLLDSSSTEASQADFLGKSGIPIIGYGYSPNIWGAQLESLGLDCSSAADTKLPCALPNAFTTGTTFGAVLDAVALVGKDQGATKVADVVCAEIAACSSSDPELQGTLTALGMDSGGLIKVGSSAPSYTSECVQLMQDKVDLVQLSLADASSRFASDCVDQGYDGWFGALTGAVCCDLFKIPGVKLLGDIQGFPWWVDDAPVKEYRDAMDAAGVDTEDWSNAIATSEWASLQLFAKANASLGDAPTATDVMANMYKIKDETLDGLLASPVTFTEGQPAPARPCFWPYVYKDGEFTNPLGGLKAQCYPAEG